MARFRRLQALAVTGGASVLSATLLAGTASAAATPTGRDIDCRVIKCVALTFDDGPGLQTTKLLAMLAAEDVRATFFVLGDVANARPAALRAIAAAGHEIGSHTWSHRQLPLLTDDGVRAQLTRAADRIEQITGFRPLLMRPPYGSVSDRVQRILGERDWPLIEWSVDPEDWKDRNADTVYRRVIAQTAPGSIVLLHDIHPTTVAAVPRILAELKDRGYTFVTVTELYGGEAVLTPGREYYGREGLYKRPATTSAPAAKADAEDAETDASESDPAESDTAESDTAESDAAAAG